MNLPKKVLLSCYVSNILQFISVAFAGSWSTVSEIIWNFKLLIIYVSNTLPTYFVFKGKTYLIGGLLGHNYSTAQSGK